jgi:hypothetical protein
MLISMPTFSPRFQRKLAQCSSFSAALSSLSLAPNSTIVDFGCGSCGLTLPLALAFPELRFVGVDIKKTALDLMEARCEEVGVANVETALGDIGAFEGEYDVAVSLHGCGQASDAAILHAVDRGRSYFVAPCCIGKVKFSLGTASAKKENHANHEGGSGGFASRTAGEGFDVLSYPRSSWLREQQIPTDVFSRICESADSSFMIEGETMNDVAVGQTSAFEYHRRCCNLVCLDRNMYAQERGYACWTCKMPGLEGSAKSDLLVGVPSNAMH